jgi:2-oxoglutarate dehydrogenase complex dehydrogenase (E1) component-like enzyme
MLRNKAAVSSVEDFTTGKFESVIPDPSLDPAAVKRVLMVSGKLYYELEHYRAEHGITDTAIIRLEQLYPIPAASSTTCCRRTARTSSSAGFRRSRRTRARGAS